MNCLGVAGQLEKFHNRGSMSNVRTQRKPTRRTGAVLLGALAGFVWVGDAAAERPGDGGGSVSNRDTVTTNSSKIDRRWRGSFASLDQSVTTQTVGLGEDYQSRNPVYELWLAVKPQYFLLDQPNDTFSVSVWANAFLELTNSDSTTKEREVLLGPTFVTAPYVHTVGHGIFEGTGYKTAVSIGPRIVLPTDKGAWNSGYIVNPGLATSVSQAIPLRGESAPFWRGARFVLGLTGGVPVLRSTSPVDGDLKRAREDVNGHLVASDQVRGSMNTKAYANVSASADVTLTERWEISASYVLLNSWAYAPTASDLCSPNILLTGCIPIETQPGTTTFRASTWMTLSANYELSKTLGLSLGYYNRALQLGPDGTRRSPLWSPDARLFVTLTGNLPVSPAAP